jgi:hypothetical protein
VAESGDDKAANENNQWHGDKISHRFVCSRVQRLRKRGEMLNWQLTTKTKSFSRQSSLELSPSVDYHHQKAGCGETQPTALAISTPIRTYGHVTSNKSEVPGKQIIEARYSFYDSKGMAANCSFKSNPKIPVKFESTLQPFEKGAP